jgi:hypothetical protein
MLKRASKVHPLLLIDWPEIVFYVLMFVLALVVVAIFFGFFGEYFIPLLLVAVAAIVMSQYAKAGQTVSPLVAVAVLMATFGFGVIIQRLALAQPPLTRAAIAGMPVQEVALVWVLLALLVVLIAAFATRAVCGTVFCRRGSVGLLHLLAMVLAVAGSVLVVSASLTALSGVVGAELAIPFWLYALLIGLLAGLVVFVILRVARCTCGVGA